MENKPAQNIQDTFLNTVRKDKTPCILSIVPVRFLRVSDPPLLRFRQPFRSQRSSDSTREAARFGRRRSQDGRDIRKV